MVMQRVDDDREKGRMRSRSQEGYYGDKKSSRRHSQRSDDELEDERRQLEEERQEFEERKKQYKRPSNASDDDDELDKERLRLAEERKELEEMKRQFEKDMIMKDKDNDKEHKSKKRSKPKSPLKETSLIAQASIFSGHYCGKKKFTGLTDKECEGRDNGGKNVF